MEHQWLSTSEAAVRLNVSREWVRLLVQRGELRAERGRSGFLIDPESIEDYAVQHAAEERAVARRRIEETRQRLAKAQETYPRFTPAEANALLHRLANIRATITGGQELTDDSTELLRQARAGRMGDA